MGGREEWGGSAACGPTHPTPLLERAAVLEPLPQAAPRSRYRPADPFSRSPPGVDSDFSGDSGVGWGGGKGSSPDGYSYLRPLYEGPWTT